MKCTLNEHLMLRSSILNKPEKDERPSGYTTTHNVSTVATLSDGTMEIKWGLT